MRMLLKYLGVLPSALKLTANLELLIAGLKSACCAPKNVPIVDLFDISESDTVWDAWLTTLTLLDMLENIQQISQYYDFQQARNKIAKIYGLAESHAIDKKNRKCLCGLSDGEHALLKRKMMRFFKLQVANLKHFIY